MSSVSDSREGSKNPKAQKFFQVGNDAALKANYDYAIQMYQEACKLEPQNLVFRQALRGIERKKFDNDPSKVGRLVGARNQPIRLRARASKSKGNYTHAIEVCEEAFVHNPWDVSSVREAAESAEHLGFKELAQWLVESVAVVANDADFFRFAAHIFEINGSWPKAIAAWERVKKLNPNDEDANRQINALSASATIQRSGLGESLSKLPSGSSGPEAASKEDLDSLKQPQLTPEERWNKEMQDDPTMIGPYLQFSEYLKDRGNLDEAVKVLARGLKVVPEDPSLKIAYHELQIGRLKRKMAEYNDRLRKRPDDEVTKLKLDQLQTMLNDYEIDEYRRRIHLNPGDLTLHYELGLRLAKKGDHKDAIAAFQQARSSPVHKVQALHQLGLSFEAEGALKLAERSYQDALKGAEKDDFTTLNSLHYRLGRIFESMGNTQAAEEHYNEVAANDYGYLDVAQRLRGLN